MLFCLLTVSFLSFSQTTYNQRGRQLGRKLDTALHRPPGFSHLFFLPTNWATLNDDSSLWFPPPPLFRHLPEKHQSIASAQRINVFHFSLPNLDAKAFTVSSQVIHSSHNELNMGKSQVLVNLTTLHPFGARSCLRHSENQNIATRGCLYRH